jgi:hypothetical protein
MNLQSLVVVILRLAALKFLVTTVATFLPQLIVSGQTFGSSPFAEPYSFVYILFIAALITGALMLWSLALPIAQRITSGLPLDLSFGALSRVDCYSIAFLGVGVWLVAVYFSQVLNWSHYLFRLAAVGEAAGEESFSQVNGYDISNSIIPFGVGVILFLNGRKWARRVAERDERMERTQAQPGSV